MSAATGQFLCFSCEGRIEWEFKIEEGESESACSFFRNKERCDNLGETVQRDWCCPNCGHDIVVAWKLKGLDPVPLCDYKFSGASPSSSEKRDSAKHERWIEGTPLQYHERWPIHQPDHNNRGFYFTNDLQDRHYNNIPDFGHWRRQQSTAACASEKAGCALSQNDSQEEDEPSQNESQREVQPSSTGAAARKSSSSEKTGNVYPPPKRVSMSAQKYANQDNGRGYARQLFPGEQDTDKVKSTNRANDAASCGPSDQDIGRNKRNREYEHRTNQELEPECERRTLDNRRRIGGNNKRVSFGLDEC